MPQPPPSALQQLRAELDRLDDAMVDGLVERLEVVRRIAGVKGDRDRGGLALRPAREAQILRRLVERTRGRFPEATLVRIWRELLAATTGMQTPFMVAVPRHAGETTALSDLARDHFGSTTPLRRVDSSLMALKLLVEGQVQVALRPMPDATESWWRSLAVGAHHGVKVIGRVPFLPSQGSLQALALAVLEPESSDDDLSLLAIDADADLSLGRLAEVLDGQGLAPSVCTSLRPEKEAPACHLVEVGGFLDGQEPSLTSRLAALRPHLVRVKVLGSYPRPLSIPAAG